VFNIGPVELMVVLVLALIVFGPAKLPELMASVGQAIREFQRASRELTEVFQETQQEFESALNVDEPPTGPAAETEPASYQVPAEEATVAAPEPVVVSQQPEEFETAAAMVDPVEPFPVPAPPDPEPVAAGADTAKPRRARRRKADAEVETAGAIAPVPGIEPVLALTPEPAAAGEDAVAAEPAAIEPAAVAGPAGTRPAARPPRRRRGAEPSAADAASTDAPRAELTTTEQVAELTTTAPAEDAGLVGPSPAPSTEVTGTEPGANGVEPHRPPVEGLANGADGAPTARRRRRATVAATAPEESP
jgi:TatA/E family protein of Tat protein translocase